MKKIIILLLMMVGANEIFAQSTSLSSYSNQYCVQVGAFKDINNAISLQNRMEKQFSGFGTQITHEDGWFKVIVGGIWSYETAGTMRTYIYIFELSDAAFVRRNNILSAPRYAIYEID